MFFKGHGHNDRDLHGYPAYSFDGGLNFLQRRHGLDPDQIDARGDKGTCLFGEGIRGIGILQLAEWSKKLSAGPDVAGGEGPATSMIYFSPQQGSAGPVKLRDLRLQIVPREAEAIASECVGENQLRSCFQVSAVNWRTCSPQGYWKA